MQQKPLLPFIYGGHGNAELFAYLDYCCFPFKIRSQGQKFEAEAVWAIWGQDIWEQRMGGFA
jgi:hypothetical protein